MAEAKALLSTAANATSIAGEVLFWYSISASARAVRQLMHQLTGFRPFDGEEAEVLELGMMIGQYIGFGRVLVVVYGVFAISASARAIVQISRDFTEASRSGGQDAVRGAFPLVGERYRFKRILLV